MRSALIVILFTLFSPSSHAQFFGVTVHHYKGDVVRAMLNSVGMHSNVVTVLAVYPQPDGKELYVGLDGEAITPFMHTLQGNSLPLMSRYFMDIIQNSYFKIAEARGLLKIGSPFQKDLAAKEPFWDGRSAAIGLFEGNGFSHPLGTFRVSYSTPEHPNLPNEGRLKIDLRDFRPDAPVEELSPDQVGRVLGLNFNSRNIVNKFGEYTASTGPGGMFFSQILKLAQPGIPTDHDIIFPNGQSLPLQMIMQYLVENYKRPILIGGHGAEIKGLAMAQNEGKTDYLFFVLDQAIRRGFFDLIPYANGYVIPTSFSAETSLDHLKKAYKDWKLKVLKVVSDPTFGNDVAAVEFRREDFGELVPMYFNRATAGGLLDLDVNNLTFQSFVEFAGKSAAWALAYDGKAPVHRVTGKKFGPTIVNRI